MAVMDPQPAVDLTDEDKLWALLSWIFSPIVPIIVLLLEDKKQRKFIKYNAIQALVVSVVGYVISAVLSAVIVGCFTGVALLVYIIYLAVQSYQGKWVTIPVVTDFCVSQGWIEKA
ncbi:MAG: DUF4870 domain-containing protein [Anaerolineae bacterium]|jgi:uncharacterized membrane protein|nr:DUF4870 domain-containing protein [Anaerolineae bacterium]